MAKLLLIDDDVELTVQLRSSLEEQGYLCETAHCALDALQLLSGFQYDVILLDWNLPDKTGLEILKEFRANGGRTPVLFLTGQGDITYKETGLDSGADDYLVKPFAVRELTARLRSLLRRPPEFIVAKLEIKGVSLEVEKRMLHYGEKSIKLMPTECSLLEFLMRHPDRTFSTKSLLDSVWSAETEASEESVRTCMKTLRHKLGKLGTKDFIKTELGSGYIIPKD